jgi:hypothetical protein
MRGEGILINENFILPIQPTMGADGKITGGLQVGNITRQNQALILVMHPGECKEKPVLGCGISDIVLDNDLLPWRHKIREQMEIEGMGVNALNFKATKELILDAKYNS